jgi:hypothetical protein
MDLSQRSTIMRFTADPPVHQGEEEGGCSAYAACGSSKQKHARFNASCVGGPWLTVDGHCLDDAHARRAPQLQDELLGVHPRRHPKGAVLPESG